RPADRDRQPGGAHRYDEDPGGRAGPQPGEVPAAHARDQQRKRGHSGGAEGRHGEPLRQVVAGRDPPRQHDEGGRRPEVEVEPSPVQARVPQAPWAVPRRVVRVAQPQELGRGLDGQARLALEETVDQVLVVVPGVRPVALEGGRAVRDPGEEEGAGRQRRPERGQAPSGGDGGGGIQGGGGAGASDSTQGEPGAACAGPRTAGSNATASTERAERTRTAPESHAMEKSVWRSSAAAGSRPSQYGCAPGG